MNAVNHPKHYSSLPCCCASCGHSIECIDVVAHMNFNRGNAVKYLWRAGSKGDALEDLRKARQYLDFEIERIGGRADPNTPNPEVIRAASEETQAALDRRAATGAKAPPRSDLARLVAESVERVAAMSVDERAAMIAAQARSWARAEAGCFD